ncbi:hypothetical protein L916_00948 [Phytophthora nicotianae]|uniref:Uncharacterized protein n=1 Tax=Phytophthora nicotianae TaxID=4792 RepID=W2JUZ0_PHYNI|nr:hypothetical protein L916_00948 [Phytophthora nicotianae]
MVVEPAFGVAKERFRVLKMCIDVDDVALHNILIDLGDDEIDFDVPIVPDECREDEDVCVLLVIREIAINKRDDIARYLF